MALDVGWIGGDGYCGSVLKVGGYTCERIDMLWLEIGRTDNSVSYNVMSFLLTVFLCVDFDL